MKSMYKSHLPRLFYAICVTVVLLSDHTSGQGICTGVTPCYCNFDNGQYLDISTLGRHDGVPRFINVTDRAETEYSWNPCFNFTEGPCHDVAICAVRPAFPSDIVFALGYQHTAQFSIDANNSVLITYTTEGDGVSPVRKAHVTLICSKENPTNMTLQPIGQKAVDSTDFYFELYSSLACPQGTPTTVPTTQAPAGPMSLASKLLIVFGVVIALLLTLLTLAVLKIKGKIFKKTEYDNL